MLKNIMSPLFYLKYEMRHRKCRTATNFGIENCPHSKSIDEAIIENTFLEMFHLLADNFDDVLDSVIRSVEETLSDDESAVKLQMLDKCIIYILSI